MRRSGRNWLGLGFRRHILSPVSRRVVPRFSPKRMRVPIRRAKKRASSSTSSSPRKAAAIAAQRNGWRSTGGCSAEQLVQVRASALALNASKSRRPTPPAARCRRCPTRAGTARFRIPGTRTRPPPAPARAPCSDKARPAFSPESGAESRLGRRRRCRARSGFEQRALAEQNPALPRHLHQHSIFRADKKEGLVNVPRCSHALAGRSRAR